MFGDPEGQRRWARKLPRIQHGTVVGYAALFVALGGTGYAATQIARGPAAHAARGGSLKVHCTAKRSGKSVKCIAVIGVVRGPRGPQGPRGLPGNGGSSGGNGGGSGGGGGNTVLTQAPAYSHVSIGSTSCSGAYSGLSIGAPSTSQWDQTQTTTGSSNCAVGNNYPPTSIYYKETGIAANDDEAYMTYLLSPSQVAGGATHLASVQFCFGAGTATAGSGSQAQTASMTITRAQVYEMDEPAAATAGAAAPPYKHELLLDDPLSLTNTSNCQTVKPAAPAAIDSAGYLMFQLLVTFHASAGYWGSTGQANTASAVLTLGRITTTYSP